MESPHVYVLHHSPCVDGFSAAWAAYVGLISDEWGVREDEVTVIGLPAGTTHVPEFKERAVIYMLDLSYPKDILLALAEKHALIVIDHHKTFWEVLQEMTEEERSRFRWIYNENHSGAVLAWKYFHYNRPVPTLLQYVEDHDLWKHELPYSEEIAAALYSYPQTFDTWTRLISRIDSLVEEGRAIKRYQDRLVEYLTETVGTESLYVPSLDKYVAVPAVNCPGMLASQVCHKLLEKHPKALLSAAYSDTGDGWVKWSLRSRNGSDVDVSEIARWYGGGGHKHAAGFRSRTAYLRAPNKMS